MQNHYFSICIDEATDVSKDISLTIIVRYTHPDNAQIMSKVWDNVKIYKDNELAKGGSERIFEIVKESIEKYKVPLKNLLSK